MGDSRAQQNGGHRLTPFFLDGGEFNRVRPGALVPQAKCRLLVFMDVLAVGRLGPLIDREWPWIPRTLLRIHVQGGYPGYSEAI